MLTERKPNSEHWLDKPDEFYLLQHEGGAFVRLEGTRARLSFAPEADVFAVKLLGGWYVIEGPSGCALNAEPEDTVESAVKQAEERMQKETKRRGLTFRQIIARHVAAALSPRYRWEEMTE